MTVKRYYIGSWLVSVIIWLLVILLVAGVAGCGPTDGGNTGGNTGQGTEVEATLTPPKTPAAPTILVTPTASIVSDAQADLSGIKTYLLDKASTLKKSTEALKAQAHSYYNLASASKFDYATLWKERNSEVVSTVEEARASWTAASPAYEQIEGIVAGVPSLAEYDVILDAGASGEEGGENVVPFDLTLPDGRVLPKPGNLFGVTESTLWGTYPQYTAQGVEADFNGNGQRDLGDALPDANVLKAGAESLDSYTEQMEAAAQTWQPTPSDALTALVVMVPTMSEYFESWKSSRFVAGEASTQRDFVAISRLSDIVDILSGLEVVYGEVSPMVLSVDPQQDRQISQGLGELKAFVADVYAQEKGGKRFTPEEADLLGAEAQNRATAIAGQVSQVAAQLDIEIQE